MVREYTVFPLQTHDSIENQKSVLCTGRELIGEGAGPVFGRAKGDRLEPANK